jgi:ribose transport system permease protein
MDSSTSEAAVSKAPGFRFSIPAAMGFQRFSGLYVWAGFILIFGILTPSTFLTSTTVEGIATNQVVTAIAALGLLFPLAGGHFDLSFANLLGFSSVLVGHLMVSLHWSPALAIVATLLVGLLFGLLNGLLVVRIGISSIVATLGTSSILLAGIGFVSHYQFITGMPPAFKSLADGKVLGLPITVLYLLAIALVAWYVLDHTPYGRRLFATGANPDAARLAGVATGRSVFIAFLASALLAAVAGILITSVIATASPTIGTSYLLPVFAAAFLGTTQVKPGRFNVWGTLIAIYLLATGVKGLQLVGGELWVTDLFNGVALLVAVSVAVIGQRSRRRASV